MCEMGLDNIRYLVNVHFFNPTSFSVVQQLVRTQSVNPSRNVQDDKNNYLCSYNSLPWQNKSVH